MWVRRLPEAGDWIPNYFEFSFGLRTLPKRRDPHSLPDPVLVDGRFKLRGSIDLDRAEERHDDPARHGSQDRQEPDDLEDGHRRRRHAAAGALQPRGAAGARRDGDIRPAVLLHGAGRLHRSRDPDQRGEPRAGLEALEIVDRAIELGFLPAAPAERRVQLVRLPSGVRPARRNGAMPAMKLAPRSSGDLDRAAGRCHDESSGAYADQRSRRARGDRQRPRRDARRRGRRGHRQDDGAGEADPADPRDRARRRSATIVAVTFTEKAAGELKLRLREALEQRARASAAEPDGAASGSTTRWPASKKRTSARSTASAPSCCASGRSKRASIRSSPCSPKAQAERLFDEAFSAWIQEQLEGSARRRAPRRCGARSGPASARPPRRGWPDRPAAARRVGAGAVARLHGAVDAQSVRS